jgi:hypothetical protein
MVPTACGIQIVGTLATPAGEHVRCPACKAPDAICYTGAGGTAGGDGRTVYITDAAGLPCGQLPEIVRLGYSPVGFTWGYEGVGPRTLARALLVHALGAAAVCGMCGATGKITYPLSYEGGDPPVSPYDPARDPEEYAAAGIVVDQCWEQDCDSGYLIHPATVHHFKRAFVARWRGSWRISRREILDWHAANGVVGSHLP